MPNDGLRELQQKKREDSIERVQWALRYLRDLEGEHCRITAVKLANISELSRATLYKSHIRSIWDNSWKITNQEKETNGESKSLNQETVNLKQEVSTLEKRLRKSDNQISRLTSSLEIEKSRVSVYRHDYEELKERQQRLLHYNLQLLRKLHLHGIDTSELDNQP